MKYFSKLTATKHAVSNPASAFTAIAAAAIVGSAFVAPSANADGPDAGARHADATAIQAADARALRQSLEARAQMDAEAMASDALLAASDLDLDIASTDLTSVLMASEFQGSPIK